MQIISRVSRFKGFVLFFLVVFLFSYFVITRDTSIGTDTLAYKNYFENINYYHIYGQHEIGFHLFNYFIYWFSESYLVYLLLLFLSFNIIFYKTMSNFCQDCSLRQYYYYFVSLIGFMFLSSWYQVATLNGLRQGMSLALFYLSISFLQSKKIVIFLIFLTISIIFHSSTVLLIPFILLLFLSLRRIVEIFTFVAILYPLGINELIIRAFSNTTGIPLYQSIYSYADGLDAWVGFQLNFYLYNCFFVFVFVFLHYYLSKFYFIKESLLKLFLVLSTAYFLYGFGVYSNRFGVMAWLFLPLIQSFYFTKTIFHISDNDFFIATTFVFLFFLGIINYYFVLRPIGLI